MRKISVCILLACLWAAPAQAAAPDDGAKERHPDSGISEAYLEQARAFRNDGRYELARQSYVQALSSCANEKTLETIKRELDAIELIIRTMR